MQGFNMGRYRAPDDLDPSLDAGRTTKKPRITAPVQHTVRFEMPFAIWCTSCPKDSTSSLIAQGVRFNATKKRVGSYFSSPIWSFRMRHPACGSTLELRTDPQNSDFTVAEGARRRDYGDDAVVAARSDTAMLSRLAPSTGRSEEEERRRQDAFAAFEGKAADKEQARLDSTRIEELQMTSQRDWSDPYATNKRLRDQFRQGRRERQAESRRKEEVAERFGLSFELLDSHDNDAARAALVDYGSKAATGATLQVDRRPFFRESRTALGGSVRDTSNLKTTDRAFKLQEEIAWNTRAAMDPFSSSDKGRRKGLASTELGIKVRTPAVESTPAQPNPGDWVNSPSQARTSCKPGVVNYDSD